MKLTFARHGESEANLLNEFSNRGLKHGLTETGRRQAAAFATSLSGAHLAAVYSSPLLRAIQTAEIVSEAIHIPFEVTPALREYDCGILEGRSDPDGWAIYNDVQQDWLVHHNWERRIEGGESFLDIQARFVPFVTALVEANLGTHGHVLLIAHGGLYRCMLPLVLRDMDFAFTLTHALGNTEAALAESIGSTLICRSWAGQPYPMPQTFSGRIL